MEEEWRKWLRENHPEHYAACIRSLSWDCEWRDRKLAAAKEENANLLRVIETEKQVMTTLLETETELAAAKAEIERLNEYIKDDTILGTHFDRNVELKLENESIKAERDEAVELLKKVVPPGEDWWCPTCQVGLSGSRVTFNEECDTCGTYLGEINAPEWAESARAFLARLEVSK
jgi:hypothetical protein